MSPSPPPSPSQSRVNLPPNTSPSSEYYEGTVPNVLIDRALGLHSKPPAREESRSGSSEGMKRSESLLSVLTSSGRGRVEGRGEREPLLSPTNEEIRNDTRLREDDLDSDEEEVPTTRRRKRTDRSRSQSMNRKLKWYQKPSPMWFLPSTLLMSLSVGMIIAPKFEIYTQLVCRNIPNEKSGVKLPAPVYSHEGLGGLSISEVDDWDLNKSSWGKGKETSQVVMLGENDLWMGKGEGKKKEEDDTWSKQCRKSPAVQAAVTRLSTILTLIMGILSALTTGYWGALSDRRGRKPILALALAGTVFMDAVFLIVVNYHATIGYNFLLIGPIFDGLLGGMSTAQAAVNAYLSDCTEAGSRARIFSILGGLLFAGIALGPTLGAISIRLTGSVMFPFYLAIAMHSVYLLCVLFLFPESLSVPRQLEARKRHQVESQSAMDRAKLQDEEAKDAGFMAVLSNKGSKAFEGLFWFAKPLALLLPKKRGSWEKEEDRPILESRGAVKEGWDWELTKVAIAYASYVMVTAIMAPKLLYASFKFSWGPQENGYYLTFLGTCRVVVLLVTLPLLIRFLRKPPPLPATPRPAGNQITPDSDLIPELTKDQHEWEEEAKYLRVVNDSHFDLFLARGSIFIDVVAYGLLAITPPNAIPFVLYSGLSSFGGGAGAALQSLALSLASPRDAGRLFASLSVLQSISSQVIGPVLFATIYIKTVSWFPEMMFWVATAIFVVSFVALVVVRLKRKIVDGEAEVEGSGERIRGRSLTRKISSLFSGGDSGIVLR